MLRRLFLTSTLFTTIAAFGQSPNPAPAFDVASVRVSQVGKAGGEGSRRERIQVSPDAVTMVNVSFRSCTRWAYHIFDYQVNGPDWINSERYDITAKATGAVAEDQLRLMMQTLLAERFKMESHHQTKEMQAYLLQIAKGGPKFKESAADGEADITPDQRTMTIVARRTPVAQLIDALSNIFRAPVIDQTGLTGKYDVTINAAKYLGDIKPNGAGESPPDPQAIIMRGLQEELGLKLEPKKMPVDLVVIDRAEKVPVAN